MSKSKLREPTKESPTAERRNLTDRYIQSRKPAPSGFRFEYPDTIVRELMVRIADNGRKTFAVVARFPAGSRFPVRRMLGTYLPPTKPPRPAREPRDIPDGVVITLAEARAKSRLWLEMIARGIDPKVEAEKEKARNLQRQANGFAAVAADYIAQHVKGPALTKLEAQAAKLRDEKPELTEDAALEQVSADSKNRELVERSKREGLAKQKEVERTINNEFVKRWGARPIADISPLEVKAAIEALRARTGVYHCFNAFRALRQLFNWAIAAQSYGLLSNPTAPLNPDVLIGKRFSRDRVLSDGELREVWLAAEQLGYPYGGVIKMLMLTGQRLREVADMAWTELHLGDRLWTIPPERSKNGVAHVVPLADDALALLKELDQLRHTPPQRSDDSKGKITSALWDHGNFIFSTTRGAKPVNGFSRCKLRLGKAIAAARAEARGGKGTAPEQQDEMPGWIIHDIRRSMRTNLSALPIEDVVREAIIGHLPSGIKKVYDRFSRVAEKRRGLELWEQRLASIVEPPPESVASIETARKAKARRRNAGAGAL